MLHFHARCTMLQWSLVFGAFTAILLANHSANAAPFVPTLVAPGSPYHLVFVTRDTRNANSTNIADYNAFVNAQAALNPTLTGTNVGVTYSAIGSTASINARVNAPVTAPVFNFNDQSVAGSFSDIWDGSLGNAVRYDQFVAIGFPDMFTGSTTAGFAFVGNELGTLSPRTGLANFSTSRWIDDSVAPQANNYAFYALSEQIIAPGGTSVPEPTSIAIWSLIGLGLAGFGYYRVRRKK